VELVAPDVELPLVLLPVLPVVPLLLEEVDGGTVEVPELPVVSEVPVVPKVPVPVPLVPVVSGDVVEGEPLVLSVGGFVVPGVVVPGVVPVVGFVPGVVFGTVCGELGEVLDGIWSLEVPGLLVLPLLVSGVAVLGVCVALGLWVVLCDWLVLCPEFVCAEEVADVPAPVLPVEPVAVCATIQPAESSKVVTVRMIVRISIPSWPATAGLNCWCPHFDEAPRIGVVAHQKCRLVLRADPAELAPGPGKRVRL